MHFSIAYSKSWNIRKPIRDRPPFICFCPDTYMHFPWPSPLLPMDNGRTVCCPECIHFLCFPRLLPTGNTRLTQTGTDCLSQLRSVIFTKGANKLYLFIKGVLFYSFNLYMSIILHSFIIIARHLYYNLFKNITSIGKVYPMKGIPNIFIKLHNGNIKTISCLHLAIYPSV